LIQNVIVIKTGSNIHNIAFTVVFATGTATLDDMFAGQETCTLRNDFSLPGMHHLGHFSTFSVKMGDKTHTLRNGSLPARYKANFSRKRIDRITDLWKTKIDQIVMKYTPPLQIAELEVERETTSQLTLTLHITNQKSFRVYMKRNEVEDIGSEVNIEDVSSAKDGWETVVDLQDVLDDGKKNATFVVSLGEGNYSFTTFDGRVSLHAQTEKQ
jgi:hypothetical protein